MLDLYKNIKTLRKKAGMTQLELAERTGYTSRTSITKIEQGKVDLPQSKITAFAKLFGVSERRLMGPPEKLFMEEIEKPATNALPIPDIYTIPILGSINCGEPVYADEDKEYIASTFRADFALRATGDSMIGAGIKAGDIVFIREQEEVENGQIAAVIVNDYEATLKRFFRYGNMIILRPENPAYPEQVYEKEELNHIRVLGKAIANLSPLH